MTSVHIINHTHWDREWFLTHEYTTAWIPDLIDSLVLRASENPDYEFLFDGQTLAIEDLANSRPEYRTAVRELIKAGHLQIGPVYSQPDWRMVGGELLLRNLLYGVDDAESMGGNPDVAWLVDTFGHISQAPQLLTLADVRAAFVWRGVPDMVPFFGWEGADGARITTVDLFGGYRNLYGVTRTPDIAVDRLVAEVNKLAPHYGSVPIPLFDGYDLDTEPEDPIAHYAGGDLPSSVDLVASSPATYIDAIAGLAIDAPVIRGELLSGRYGATFPGSLSTRTYLKVLHHDAEVGLLRRAEPLAVLAVARVAASTEPEVFEAHSRTLLQNGVHDCLCGVSIDQVHERMERSYRRMLAWVAEEERSAAGAILRGFAPGTYAISTNPMPVGTVLRSENEVHAVAPVGVGVTPVLRSMPIDGSGAEIDTASWANEHYAAEVDADGLRIEGAGRLRFVVRTDDGDTYSSEPGALLGNLSPDGPLVEEEQSLLHRRVSVPLRLRIGSIDVTARVWFTFDAGPVIGVDVHLDSIGSGFRVDTVLGTGIDSESVHAGMPFDIVERPHADTHLLDHDIDPALAAVLMGQRETGRVDEFPFHGFVAQQGHNRVVAVLAAGCRSYSSAPGQLAVTLRRSVDWLALSGLAHRAGDAGPAMYVPGARCERDVSHRLAIAVHKGTVEDLVPHNEVFQNPPLLATVSDGPANGPQVWTVLTEDVPLSSLFRTGDRTVARLYNPTGRDVPFREPRSILTPRGEDLRAAHTIGAKKIVTAAVELTPPPMVSGGADDVAVLNPTSDRVGPSRSRPDPAVLEKMERRIRGLTEEIARNGEALEASDGRERLRLQHRHYVLDRERLELALSLTLNRRLAESNGEVSIGDEPEPDIADLGWSLNELRIQRRIYDYVVQAL